MEFQTIQAHIAFEDGDEFKYLVLQRSDKLSFYPGLWQVITGTIERNETAYETTIRELKEETNLIPLKIWYLPYVTTYFVPKKNKVLSAPTFGILVHKNSEVVLSDEHQAYKWLDFYEAEKILALPGHKEAHMIFKDYILRQPANDIYYKLKT